MRKKYIAIPVYKHHSFFFYTECEICKDKFKREEGFKVYHNCPMGDTYPEYFCSQCVSSEDDVRKWIKKDRSN